jgi:dinuclear metal center YbgI/SA1388 family protein
MLLKDITDYLESWAPLSLQESYDNCGLLVGAKDQEIHRALISLDITEEVIEEAIKTECNLIIAHHPVIFSGLKKLNGSSMTERVVIAAIKNNIALYAIHTNLDNTLDGVNLKICERIGIRDPKIIDAKKGLLKKLVTFCPEDGKGTPEKVRQALWEAGAGQIGNYDACSFNMEGIGTFRANSEADPYIGKEGELTRQPEVRVEVIYPAYLQNAIISRLLAVHPYEEVAYDIYALDNHFQSTGAGMVGEMDHDMEEIEFLKHLKTAMQAGCVRYSPVTGKKIKKVAVCGGSGSFLLKQAIAAGADVLVTADFKYHQFFDAEGQILIADIGHYESEQFTIGLIFDKMSEKFPTFALLKTRVITNPVNYI